MEWRDVLRRIEAGEDQQTEFKRGIGDGSGVCRSLCAFGNGDGGMIILGVEDPGMIVGVQDPPDTVQERLTSFLQTGCSVPISARCGRHQDPNGWVHWIEVLRQPRGYEPLRYHGRHWIRRLRSSIEPSPSELQELFNNFGFVLTEEQRIRTGDMGGIDISAFRSFLQRQDLASDEDRQSSTEADMKNAGVLVESDGCLVPTLYGAMVFGRDSQSYPQIAKFFIRCAAYSGPDRGSDILSVGESKGRLEDQISRSLGWFVSLGRRKTYRGIWRNDKRNVLERALREALVNAVVHREYAIIGSSVMFEVFNDRIDVTSPGTLPNHMTIESVQSGSFPRSRNKSMAHAMVVARLMEQRGRGWPVMRRAMREFNGTEPELFNDEGGRFVRVRFHVDPELD